MASCVNRMWDRDRPKGERCKAVPWRGIECGIEIDRRMNGAKVIRDWGQECGIEIDRRVNSAEVETKLILEVEQQLHVDVGRDRFHVNFGASFSLAPSCTARLYMLKALGWLRLDPEYSNDAPKLVLSSPLCHIPHEQWSITAGPELLRLLNSTSRGTQLRRGYIATSLRHCLMFCGVDALHGFTSAQDSSVAVWLLAATSTLRRDRTNLVFEFGIQRTSSRLAHRESMLHDGREHMDVGAGEGSNNKLELLDADVSAGVGVEALGRCFGIAVKLRRSETVHVWSESEIVFCSNWLQIESSVVFLTVRILWTISAATAWQWSCGTFSATPVAMLQTTGHGQREFTNAMKVDMVKGNSQQRSLYCWTWDRWRGKFDTGWVVGAGNVVPRAAGSLVFNIGVGALGLARRVTDMMIERKRWALVSLQYKTQLGIDKGS
ncbi:hypothetical protein C8F04DRAFT_1192820 [Mycena alexandri]|uniref:Uncharacterized protein n=1 Tax=Mycena alexandri TaxID=1745969 RepID=A0AAD6WSU7_9AGAR|nr:hypothetical protein C8F04DRAFT_1195343 [Mycena alexandri]KAJ7024082.1 hypothetical protein C8F04DRAFT_1192820 [Mycena alexandri]